MSVQKGSFTADIYPVQKYVDPGRDPEKESKEIVSKADLLVEAIAQAGNFSIPVHTIEVWYGEDSVYVYFTFEIENSNIEFDEGDEGDRETPPCDGCIEGLLTQQDVSTAIREALASLGYDDIFLQFESSDLDGEAEIYAQLEATDEAARDWYYNQKLDESLGK